MKKIVFIFALIAGFASGVRAQNQHYHRVGDTIFPYTNTILTSR